MIRSKGRHEPSGEPVSRPERPDAAALDEAAGTTSSYRHLVDTDRQKNAQGLYDLLRRLQKDYPFPALIITENGLSLADRMGPDGRVDDPERVAYLRAHISKVGQAILDGIPVTGYFVWSLFDNFTFVSGYGARYGIIFTDYTNLLRIPKTSSSWYTGIVSANVVSSDD
jgi:beta-glucosidase/6-phospho-beta-glucosidase/beta-galactosidase